jgi:hypothetical protein
MLSAFDRAVEVKRSVVPYSYKVEAHTRPYADEAIVEMIDEGYHREAVLYLGLVYGGVNAIIQNDAPQGERAAVQAGYDRLLSSLDLIQSGDWPGRVERARGCADQVCRLADSHLVASP